MRGTNSINTAVGGLVGGNGTQATGDGTTTYSHDRANRLTGIDFSDSTPDVSYSYDAADHRTQMTDGYGTETFTYDNATVAVEHNPWDRRHILQPQTADTRWPKADRTVSEQQEA